MEVGATYVRQLIGLICKKTNQQLSRDGLIKAAVEMKLNEQYLYKSLYYPVYIQMKDSVKLNDDLLSRIVKFLGYETYEAFTHATDFPIDRVLSNTQGTYWSYVRMNADDGNVLCSPARIVTRNNRVTFELRGPKRTYQGNVNLEGGCLFISMMSEIGKSFHHVYKIGKADSPKILMGVFSGVSSAFEPIAGRCVLVRSDVKFDLMKNESIPVSTLRKSGRLEKALARFFKERSKNNLLVGSVTTNDLQDLEGDS